MSRIPRRFLVLGLALPAMALGTAACSSKATPPGPPTKGNTGGFPPGMSSYGYSAQDSNQSASATPTIPVQSASSPAAPSSGPTYSSTTSTTSGPTPPGTTITIRNDTYQPSVLRVAPGAVVSVQNEDNVAQDLTASGSHQGDFDSGVVPGHSTGQFTAPGTPGTYSYVSTAHPQVHGTLIVR